MKKIIACLGRTSAEDVCEAAVWAAATTQQPLLFVHALEKSVRPVHSSFDGMLGLENYSELLEELTILDEQRNRLALDAGRMLLDGASQLAQKQGLEQVETLQQHSSLVEMLSGLTDSSAMMLLGKAQEPIVRIEHVIQQVKTPLLLVRPNFHEPKRFMLAYDGRETAERIVRWLTENDLLQGLDCHVVSVRNKTAQQEDKLRAACELLEQSGYRVTATFLEGSIFTELDTYVRQQAIDVVAMGAFSRSKLMRAFVGSNTSRMISHSAASLLIVQ